MDTTHIHNGRPVTVLGPGRDHGCIGHGWAGKTASKRFANGCLAYVVPEGERFAGQIFFDAPDAFCPIPVGIGADDHDDRDYSHQAFHPRNRG